MQSNALPPADLVRIEEFINYFSYNYPEAEPDKPFSVTMEMGKSPWNNEAEIIMIGLKGRTVDPSLVPNSNLTFSSMSAVQCRVKISCRLLKAHSCCWSII